MTTPYLSAEPYNSWKYVVPLTIVVLVVGLVLTLFNSNAASVIGNMLLVAGLVLSFYSLYLFASR